MKKINILHIYALIIIIFLPFIIALSIYIHLQFESCEFTHEKIQGRLTYLPENGFNQLTSAEPSQNTTILLFNTSNNFNTSTIVELSKEDYTKYIVDKSTSDRNGCFSFDTNPENTSICVGKDTLQCFDTKQNNVASYPAETAQWRMNDQRPNKFHISKNKTYQFQTQT